MADNVAPRFSDLLHARRHHFFYSMLGVARYICFLCKRKFGSAALLTKHKLRAQQLVPLNARQSGLLMMHA